MCIPMVGSTQTGLYPDMRSNTLCTWVSSYMTCRGQRLWNPQHYCSLKSFYLVANQQTIYHATLSVYKLKLLVQELEKMFQKNVTAKEGTEHHVPRAGDGKTKKKRRARVHTHTHAYTHITHVHTSVYVNIIYFTLA